MAAQAQKIYISDPIACPAALILKFLSKADLIYHEHDSPGEEPGEVNSVFMKWVLKTRKRIAQSASSCILPNEERCHAFIRQTGTNQKVFCVWNCPLLQEVRHEKKLALANNSGLRVLYQGSIVPCRVPLEILTALAKLPDDVKLIIAGYETIGHPNYVKTLFKKAEELNLKARLEYAGALNRKDLFKLSATCDVGLALMPMQTGDVNMKYMVGASNKPFDYLACGLALLVPDLPDWKDQFVAPGYGLACRPDNPDSIAQVLRWLLNHPVERQAMGEAGRQRILMAWNYEKQFSILYSILGRERSDALNKESKTRI